jgi:spore maturation protein A
MLLNYIWGFLILISLVTSIFTNTLSETASELFNGANDALGTVFSFGGAIIMWCGMMEIASESGLTNIFVKFISPITRVIFPRLKKDSKALKAISMNMVANILGLSNAATPLGLKAMEELNKISNKNEASNEMCTFVILNTASIQLLPSTLIAIRTSLGSNNPGEIIVPIWITSVLTAFFAVLLSKFYEKRSKL